MFALLVIGLIAVAISGWLVLDSAAQLTDHSKRQTTATEYALTLTRLASKINETSGQSNGVVTNDDIARLVAMGDVQSDELRIAPGAGWLKRPEIAELHPGGEAIAMQWKSIRSKLNGFNSAVVHGQKSTSTEVFSATALESLIQTFDTVFVAITNETLSVPLLRNVSEVRAELSNLYLMSGLPGGPEVVERTNQTLGQLLISVDTLQTQSLGEEGVSLLGYESNILLQEFVGQVSELRPIDTRRTELNSTDSSTGGAEDWSGIEDEIVVALDQNEIYRRALDGAIYQYRRAILGALAAVCAALLLSAVVTWRLWRAKLSPAVQPADDLHPMILDINALADGDLTTQVRSLNGESTAARQSRLIAQGVNYAGQMLRGLVEVSRGVAHRTRTLSKNQHDIASELIEAESNRQRQAAVVVDGLNQRNRELLELIDHEKLAASNLSAVALESDQIAKVTTSALASVSAQIELSVSRVTRTVETVNELVTTIDKMKVVAEKSSLQALNTSIQMSAYSDGVGESDVSPKFVDQTQRSSRQLEASASEAGRLLERLKTDLHASGLAMASCASAIDDGAEHSIHASQSLSAVTGAIEIIGESNTRLIDELKQEAENLNHVAGTLNHFSDAANRDSQLRKLLESTSDLQLMSVNFEQSLSRYKLDQEQSVDG